MRRFIMRKLSIPMTVVLIALLLSPVSIFAQGDSESTAPAVAGPVEFEFWTTETQSDRQATIQVLIDTYEAMNPGVSIKLIPVDENDMATQLQTASSAGTLPAMIEIGAENAVAFGEDGLMNTEATRDLIDRIGKDSFYSGAMKLVESESGAPYALPFHGWVQGIWYRSDWFEEAGLEPPNTWENILKAAEYFYNPADNQYGILVGTKAENYAEQCFTPIAMANNAQLFNKDGELIFNSPEMKEAVEFYAELAKFNPPGPQTWRARDYYLQGKMAMFFYSTYIMDDLALQDAAAGSLTSENFSELAGGTFDPQLVDHTSMQPMITNKTTAGYGVVVTLGLINQPNTAQTQAAADFIRYLYTPNAYITFLHMAPGGMNPVIKGIAGNARFQNDPKGIFQHYGPEKMQEISEGMNDIASFSIVDGKKINVATEITTQQIIPQMIYRITQEDMNVDAAMNLAEREMRKLLD
jgi:multiple sugar transport system substrate-binding protein